MSPPNNKFFLERNGRFYEKQHAKRTNPEALHVPPDRYELPSPESPLLMDCQTRRDKVKPVKKTDTPATPRAVSQKQQGRDRKKGSPPLPAHQLPSSLTSLPVRSRQPPASDTECDKCHGTGRVSTSQKPTSRSRDSINRMKTHAVFSSSDAKREAASYPKKIKNLHKNRRPAPPKSLHGHAIAKKEEYVVVDPSDRGDDEGEGGWEMDFPMGE